MQVGLGEVVEACAERPAELLLLVVAFGAEFPDLGLDKRKIGANPAPAQPLLRKWSYSSHGVSVTGVDRRVLSRR